MGLMFRNRRDDLLNVVQRGIKLDISWVRGMIVMMMAKGGGERSTQSVVLCSH